MAAEVIALLHSLLVAAETQAADTWRVAMDKVSIYLAEIKYM